MRYASSLPLVLVAMTIESVVVLNSFGDEWPQWRGPNRDGVWHANGLIERFEGPEVRLKWKVPISSGYSGPTVANDRVFVMDRIAEPKQQERVLCVSADTGRSLWTHAYDCQYEGFGYVAGPRASVLVAGRRAYSLGAMGHLLCLDTEEGTVIWERDLHSQYKIRMPNWGIAASPIREQGLIIVQIGGDDSACVVAFDQITGEERWKALADDASYSAPIVVEQAGRRVLVVWTGDRVVGLDPRHGKELWAVDFKWEKWPIGIATPVVFRDKLLISETMKGTLLLQLNQDRTEVTTLWHRRKQELEDGRALHCLISTPFIQDGHIYGADGNGTLRCLDLLTGQQLWEDQSACPKENWATIHLVPQGSRTWLFNERGELIIARLTPRGYDEVSRAKLLDPTTGQLRRRGGVTWTHPAFAGHYVFARNDEHLVCADLAAGAQSRTADN